MPSDLLELYKLACEMADRVSAWRATANNYLFTIHAALLAGLATGKLQVGRVYIAGIMHTAVWWLLLRRYRDLNRAKFAVILDMEAQLPWQVYGDEWKPLKDDRLKR